MKSNKNQPRFLIQALASVVLCVMMGCTVDFISSPKADFNYQPSTDLKTGDTIVFANTSEHAETYFWDFGDSTTSTEKDPRHVYTEKKVYQVKLIASKEAELNGQPIMYVDSIVKEVNVAIEPPIPYFGFKRDGIYSITFMDSSLHATDYHWDFGDGTFSTEKNPTHSYETFGSFDVTLTTHNDGVDRSFHRSVLLEDEMTIMSGITSGDSYAYKNRLYLDVDWDGINDFWLYWTSMGMSSGIWTTSSIEAYNGYEVFQDSIQVEVVELLPGYVENRTTQSFIVPKVYNSGDTIDGGTHSKQALSMSRKDIPYSFGTKIIYCPFPTGETRYIGYCKREGSIPLMGWIKVRFDTDYFGFVISYKLPERTNTLLINK